MVFFIDELDGVSVPAASCRAAAASGRASVPAPPLETAALLHTNRGGDMRKNMGICAMVGTSS